MKRNYSKIIVVVMFTLFVIEVFAQNKMIQPDKRLGEVFEKSYLENISKNYPDSIRYYNFYLDNSYSISKLPEEKMKANKNKFEHLTLKNKDLKDDLLENINEKQKINILKYNYIHLQDKNKTYIINEELGYIIVFHSLKRIASDYKNFSLNKNN